MSGSKLSNIKEQNQNWPNLESVKCILVTKKKRKKKKRKKKRTIFLACFFPCLFSHKKTLTNRSQLRNSVHVSTWWTNPSTSIKTNLLYFLVLFGFRRESVALVWIWRRVKFGMVERIATEKWWKARSKFWGVICSF